jgi:hypothetical protein
MSLRLADAVARCRLQVATRTTPNLLAQPATSIPTGLSVRKFVIPARSTVGVKTEFEHPLDGDGIRPIAWMVLEVPFGSVPHRGPVRANEWRSCGAARGASPLLDAGGFCSLKLWGLNGRQIRQ